MGSTPVSPNFPISIETASLAGTLERQLRLLRELSADLVTCRAAYVSMDLEAMYHHIATQAALCDELRELEAERQIALHAACRKRGIMPEAANMSLLLARLEPEVAARVRQIVTELALAEGELRQLNRAHSVLIEGSRRTLNILANVVASFSPTYSRPRAIATESAATESTKHAAFSAGPGDGAAA